MHCDDLFELLTCTPNSGNPLDDPLVASHLARCDSCRQLATAVAPAVELLCAVARPTGCGDQRASQRSALEAQRFDARRLGAHAETTEPACDAVPLPSAAGPSAMAAPGGPEVRHVSGAQPVGRSTRAQKRCWASASATRRRVGWAVALLGTAAAVLLMATGWYAALLPGEADSRPRWMADSQGIFWVNSGDAAALRLAAACLGHDGPSPAVSEPTSDGRLQWRLDCCTRCHTADSAARVAHVALSRVTAHCGLCHLE
jgi:hypothetical protein